MPYGLLSFEYINLILCFIHSFSHCGCNNNIYTIYDDLINFVRQYLHLFYYINQKLMRFIHLIQRNITTTLKKNYLPSLLNAIKSKLDYRGLFMCLQKSSFRIQHLSI